MAMAAAAVIAAGLSMAPAQAVAPARGSLAGPPPGVEMARHKEKGAGYRAQAGEARGQGRARRHAGQGMRKGPGYGYVGNCEWLRGRALTGHSPVWWRKYKQHCLGR